MAEEKEEGARSFTRFIDQLAYGEVQGELSEDLHDLISTLQKDASMHQSKAKGALTLKLDIEVDDRGVATVKPLITVKKPKSRRSPATMWVTAGGNLTPQNPRQQELPLREVTGNTNERREAAAREV